MIIKFNGVLEPASLRYGLDLDFSDCNKLIGAKTLIIPDFDVKKIQSVDLQGQGLIPSRSFTSVLADFCLVDFLIVFDYAEWVHLGEEI